MSTTLSEKDYVTVTQFAYRQGVTAYEVGWGYEKYAIFFDLDTANEYAEMRRKEYRQG